MSLPARGQGRSRSYAHLDIDAHGEGSLLRVLVVYHHRRELKFLQTLVLDLRIPWETSQLGES